MSAPPIESLLLVDADDSPIGSRPRDDVLSERLWHRASGGVVVDVVERLVLCHRRSSEKDERPGLWVATFGGKSSENEDPLSTAQRELREEYGIDLSADMFSFYGKHRSEERRQFEYLYVVPFDCKSEVKFDLGEVAEVRWVSKEELSIHLVGDDKWYIYGYELDIINSAI